MRAAQKACLHILQNHSYCERKQKLGSNTVELVSAPSSCRRLVLDGAVHANSARQAELLDAPTAGTD